MKLTEKQIIDILENKTIDKCTKSEKEQVFNFAFGSEFMNSNDKGKKKTYKTIDKKQLNNMSYYIHPDLPNTEVYANDISKIPAKKGIDKSKYILVNK